MRLIKKLPRFVVLMALGLRTAGVLGAREETGEAPSATPHPAKEPNRVFDQERPRGEDILLLQNGDKLTGTILNDTVSIQTFYGRLEFKRELIAGINLERNPQNIESIVTVNYNRFSGFIGDPVFHLRRPTAPRIDVRKEKVLRVIFRRRPEEESAMAHHRFIVLKNGDFFSGRLLHAPLTLITGHTRVAVQLGEVEWLRFPPGKDPLTKVRVRHGGVLEGRLETEDLPIQLDLGMKVQIYQDRIDVIYGAKGFVPEIAGLAEIESSPAQPVPPAFSVQGPKPKGMVWIPPGHFTMGSPPEEAGRGLDEGPRTRVTLTQGFWMKECEVTQAEYQALMGENPSHFIGDPRRPVEKVSWQEAVEYCKKLTRRERAEGTLPLGYAYRLPTEAEWEYACRAGTATRFSYGDDPDDLRLADYAWFVENSDSTTHPVRGKKPNPWGLYDMHGNVWEWCLDRSQGSFPGGTVTDPHGNQEGSLRVTRGGSWLYDAKFCRSANRDDYGPSNRCSDVGFRVVLAPAAAGEEAVNVSERQGVSGGSGSALREPR